MLRRSRGHGAGRSGTWIPGERSAASAERWAQGGGSCSSSFIYIFFLRVIEKKKKPVFAMCSAERLARVKPAGVGVRWPQATFAARLSCPGKLAKKSLAACCGGNAPPAPPSPGADQQRKHCVFFSGIGERRRRLWEEISSGLDGSALPGAPACVYWK